MTRTLMALFYSPSGTNCIKCGLIIAFYSLSGTIFAQDKLILFTRAENCDLKAKPGEMYAVTATHLKAKKNAERFILRQLDGMVLDDATNTDPETHHVDLDILNRPLDIQFTITITQNSKEIWYCGGMLITDSSNFPENVDVLTLLSLQNVCKSSGEQTIELTIEKSQRDSIILTLQ